jgi:hypothetical protein
LNCLSKLYATGGSKEPFGSIAPNTGEAKLGIWMGDTASFASMAELLRLLQDAEHPIPRTLTISGPPAVDDPRVHSNYRYAKTWKIEYLRTATEPHWEWSGDTHHPVLHLGAELLTEFIECLANERCEDYGIGKKEAKSKNITDLAEAQLWFWGTMGP